MKKLFASVSSGMKKFGDIISTIVLSIFYLTIFALFAIPSRIFGDFLHVRKKTSNFQSPKHSFETLESYRYEG